MMIGTVASVRGDFSVSNNNEEGVKVAATVNFNQVSISPPKTNSSRVKKSNSRTGRMCSFVATLSNQTNFSCYHYRSLRISVIGQWLVNVLFVHFHILY